MYILGIGPVSLPTAERVDYIDLFVGDSFFVGQKRLLCVPFKKNNRWRNVYEECFEWFFRYYGE